MSQYPLEPDIEMPDIGGNDARIDKDAFETHDATHVAGKKERFGVKAPLAVRRGTELDRWRERRRLGDGVI